MDHATRGVRREHRRRQLGVAEPDQAVGVVLEDPETVLGRELDEALALGGREGAAGRVVEVGDHVDELDRTRRERPLECLDVQAVGLQRHPGELGAGAAEQQQRAVVRGLLDDHPVARLDHVAEQQRRRLHRAVGEHHLLGLEPVELARDPLAEARMADSRAVGERPLPVRFERLRGRLADRIDGEDVGARRAAGEADRVRGHRRPTIATALALYGVALVENVDEILALAERLAGAAAALSLERLREPRADVRTKSSATDMVSEVDEACERLIVDGIRAARPDDGVLSEEGAAVESSSGVRWVIDPIDGTTNYLYGHPGLRDLDRGRARRSGGGGRGRGPASRRAVHRRARWRGAAQRRADPGLGRDRARLGAGGDRVRLRPRRSAPGRRRCSRA